MATARVSKHTKKGNMTKPENHGQEDTIPIYRTNISIYTCRSCSNKQTPHLTSSGRPKQAELVEITAGQDELMLSMLAPHIERSNAVKNQLFGKEVGYLSPQIMVWSDSANTQRSTREPRVRETTILYTRHFGIMKRAAPDLCPQQ